MRFGLLVVKFDYRPIAIVRIVSGAPTQFYARVSQSYPGAADCTLGGGLSPARKRTIRRAEKGGLLPLRLSRVTNAR